MLLGTDELTILRGSKFYGTWLWINSVTGDPEDFAGLTASVKIKNIHEDFAGIKNTYEVGTAIVEPLDIDDNAFKGRVDIELSKEETLFFAIPEGEDDRYGESDFYAILEILLSTGEVILQAKVRVVESLESETLNFLLDEKDEAIIINGKLDNILLRNNEFISTRDNLIDIVIPTAINTYNEKLDLYNQNHIEKLDTYNLNHADKLQILEDIATIVNQDKSIVGQDKLDIEAMKQNVLNNKDSVTSMKDAIEIMLDTFDDRFLGRKDSDPTTDNDGEPLSIAALYYNEIDKELKFYNGVSWDSPVAAAQTYAQQASQSADSANTSKLAAKTSEDNAKTSEDNAKASEEIATQKANQILNLDVDFQMLNPGEIATGSYNPETGIMTFSIPKGDKGDAFTYNDFTSEQRESLKGSNGLSAYEIAVNNGFVGTELEWLNSFNTPPTVEEIPELPINKITNLNTTLNQKINISDTQDVLNSIDTNKPLSANQGRVLKGFIDGILEILNSDDTALDELQEIVNFIKQNKSTLDTLGISNIAGLSDALNNIYLKSETYSKTQVDDILLSVIPAGTVIHFAGSTVPAGFLELNGAELSRTVYADLFAVVGTVGGAGDGSTTFNLRDARGEFIRGWDNGRGVDTGRTLGSYQADAYESHTHTGSTNSTGAHTHTYTAHTVGSNGATQSGTGFPYANTTANTSSAGAHSHTVTIDASGSTETRPRNIAFMTCIKY